MITVDCTQESLETFVFRMLSLDIWKKISILGHIHNWIGLNFAFSNAALFTTQWCAAQLRCEVNMNTYWHWFFFFLPQMSHYVFKSCFSSWATKLFPVQLTAVRVTHSALLSHIVLFLRIRILLVFPSSCWKRIRVAAVSVGYFHGSVGPDTARRSIGSTRMLFVVKSVW